MSIGIPRIRDANTETLTSNPTVLTAASAYHQNLDSDGAKDVDMPSGTGTQGGECMITNSGGEESQSSKVTRLRRSLRLQQVNLHFYFATAYLPLLVGRLHS
jgi:hypothetical protein